MVDHSLIQLANDNKINVKPFGFFLPIVYSRSLAYLIDQWQQIDYKVLDAF